MGGVIYPINDKKYTAEDVEIFNCTRTSGVYTVLDFDFTLSGNTMTIGKGLAWIKNADFSGKAIAFKEPQTLIFDSADSELDRYDVVAIRYDATKKEPEIVIVKGGVSETPTLPTRKTESYMYELFLYSVLRKAGEGSISADNITDLRANEVYCGLMRDSVTSAVAPIYETLFDSDTEGSNKYEGDTIDFDYDKYEFFIAEVGTTVGDCQIILPKAQGSSGLGIGILSGTNFYFVESSGNSIYFRCQINLELGANSGHKIALLKYSFTPDFESEQRAHLTKLVGVTERPEGYVKVDSMFNAKSQNAQSGEAVAQAILPVETLAESLKAGDVDDFSLSESKMSWLEQKEEGTSVEIVKEEIDYSLVGGAVSGTGVVSDSEAYQRTDYIEVKDFEQVYISFSGLNTEATSRNFKVNKFDENGFVSQENVDFKKIESDGTLNTSGVSGTHSANIVLVNDKTKYPNGLGAYIDVEDSERLIFSGWTPSDVFVDLEIYGVFNKEVTNHSYTIPEKMLPSKLIVVDETFNPDSDNAQSGKAVAQAIEGIKLDDIGTEELNRVTEGLFLKESLNLCNPEEIVEGEYIDVTGVVKPSSSYKHTGLISVNAGDILTFFRTTDTGGVASAQTTRVCAYNEEGNALSELGAQKVTVYVVPEGITSVVVSFTQTYEGLMVLGNHEGVPTKPIEYHPAFYVASEKFIENVCYTKPQIDGLFDELENGNITEQYIFDEIERVRKETLKNDGVLNFVFQTDQHIDARGEGIHQIYEAVKVADIGQFDFVCFGGDLTQAGDTSWYAEKDDEGNVISDNGFVDKKPIVLKQFSEISKITNKIPCPVYYTIGNHDVCFGAYHGARNRNEYYGYKEGDSQYINPDSQSVLPSEFFRIFNNKLGESVVWDSENPKGGYFYKDFDRSKIRVVVLQTQDVFNDDGSVVDTVNDTSLNPRIQQKQFTWFCNKALDFTDKGEDKKDWAVIVISHANVLLGGASGGSISNEQCVLMRGVINAFMTGGVYTGSTPDGFTFPLSADVDFTEQGAADFICSVNGHVHADTELNIGYVIDNYTGYEEPLIDRPCIQMSASNGTVPKKDYSQSTLKDYFGVPDREVGTVTVEAFDVFSVDRNNRTIKTIRFGAGEDRVIEY